MTTFHLSVIILAAIGNGLMSGLFFTFSNFVMQALGKLPANQGSAAMQSINITIINPVFLAAFLGTAILSLISMIFAVQHWGRPGSTWLLAGALLYLVGCFLVTARFNVPLNDQLAALDPDLPENFPLWEAYLASWLPWNHMRTFSTLASTACLAIALTTFDF